MPNNLDWEHFSSCTLSPWTPTSKLTSRQLSPSPSVQTAGLTQLLSAQLSLARGQGAEAGPVWSTPTHSIHSQPPLTHSGFYIVKVNIQSRKNLGTLRKLINPLRVHLWVGIEFWNSYEKQVNSDLNHHWRSQEGARKKPVKISISSVSIKH